MTFEEYAIKNIQEMKSREPTAQNMRDVALLELWLASNNNNTIVSSVGLPETKKETNDVLPAYFFYLETKRKYQMKDTTKEKMLDSFKTLSDELKDLFRLIYRNTDTSEEREILNTLISEINVGNI